MTVRVLYEDPHLLAVDKPAGINTHRPDVDAPAGLHEFLTHPNRGRADWGALSVLHRLDKATSGVLVFGKSRLANQSLTEQFRTRQIRKVYLLWTGRRPRRQRVLARSPQAITEFELVGEDAGRYLVRAVPRTGKTHQIRRHAAASGFPVLGDTEYGGPPAPRLMLHAYQMVLCHPQTRRPLTLTASVPDAFVEFDPLVAARELRTLLFSDADADTDAYRLVAGAGDGFPEVVVDWWAGVALLQWQRELPEPARAQWRTQFAATCHPDALAEQVATRRRRTPPRWIVPPRETAAAGRDFTVTENGMRFLIRFDQGYSPGLFLDQRENRLQLRRMDLRGQTVLNCFAYTCGFSVAAALAGARVTSIDLSRNYLAWGRRNFQANGLDPAAHEFVAGDVFAWLRRAAGRPPRFDVVLLDPPTFSTSKTGAAFQAERDYLELAIAAQNVLGPVGTLFASTNQRTVTADRFRSTVREAARRAGRIIEELEGETQPLDFRVAAGESPHLKTLWARLATPAPTPTRPAARRS
ncbi:class I SAM-dependent methyltransferase [bacterium]|nr:class I SAM-dependent methyltransferase [bacterium]